MADIKKLAEKRANLLTEATSIVADLAEKGSALEGEAQARFESLTNEAGVIAEAIRSEKSATEARSAADVVRAEFASVIAPATQKDADEVEELRALGRNGGSRMFEYRDVTKSTGLGNPVTIADRVNVVQRSSIHSWIQTLSPLSERRPATTSSSHASPRLAPLVQLLKLAQSPSPMAPCRPSR